VAEASRSFRERLVWDAAKGEIVDGPVRYLLIRPDTFMGLFARLDPVGRGAALDALRDATREFGGRSASRYQDMGASDADRLFATIAATAPQLGWGRWSFRRTDDNIALAVENSPFAAGIGSADQPVCAAIAGMLGAVASLALGRPMAGEEIECSAVAGHGPCRFRARPA
jgi:predicted hydrocarbon binding protein